MITKTTNADVDHQVVTVQSKGEKAYMKKPCPDCPWRKDAVGEFPAEAFRISAPTGYDMSDRMFGCHSSGTTTPKTCAGFLLRGAEHNMAVRFARMTGEIKDDVSDSGLELFDNYVDMAVANGVDPDDPVLTPVRQDQR